MCDEEKKESYFDGILEDIEIKSKQRQLDKINDAVDPVDKAVATIITFVGLSSGDDISGERDIEVIKAAVKQACYVSVEKYKLEKEIEELKK